MSEHNRRTWGLIILILASGMALVALFVRLYQLILLPATPTIAILTISFSLLFLTAVIVGVTTSFISFKLGFACGRERSLKNPPEPGEVVTPFEVKLFGRTLASRPAEPFLFKIAGEPMDEKSFERKPFYDDETVQARIHKWERQKNALPTKTMTKFLTQEITIRPDGSLHIPLETFFLWRKRNPKDSKN